jgi:hypothetical protein
MVRRYAHFSAENSAPYADRLEALRAVVDAPSERAIYGTNTAQCPNQQGVSRG